MGQYTLTKYEKRLVDNHIVKEFDFGHYTDFSPATFNHTLCTVLPQWRVEELTKGQNNRNLAYVNYMSELYKSKKIKYSYK